ncbi:MAG TPA: hypothetical protein VFV70_05970, partial [Hyphomonadaceae bacterium]|nr:hypothetical protein [Hyphomonadaceae bacterium]
MSGFGKQGTSVTALREQMRAVAQKNNPPPPPKKKGKGQELEDIRDKAAEAAERKSLVQHQTSLLSKQPKNSRLKAVEEKKPGIPFVVQITLVLLVVGGAAVALDPTLMG